MTPFSTTSYRPAASPITTAILLWLLFALFGATAHAADVAKRSFDIPAGEASIALKQFAQQAGCEIVFPADAVGAIITNAVKGDYIAADAIEALIEGTGLIATVDKQTGAYAIRLKTAPDRQNTVREDGVVVLEKMEIIANKVDGLYSQTIFDVRENSAIRHEIITQEDIQRFGVGDMSELLTRLPGFTGYGAEFLQDTADLAVQHVGVNGTYLSMRGFESSQTVVLLNGRRLPNGADGKGPDLSRISLASVERIEVLPFSAGAMYSDNALGGAINIITRKDYQGRILSGSFGVSSHGDAERTNLTWLEDIGFNKGRTSVKFTLSYDKIAGLKMGERNFLERLLKQWPSTDTTTVPSTSSAVANRTVFERFVLPVLSSGRPVFNILPGTSNTIKNLGIPSDPTARFAMLPAGYAGNFDLSQPSTLLTPASFNTTTNELPKNNRHNRLWLSRPSEAYSFTGTFQHAVLPKDRLDIYGEIQYNIRDVSLASPSFVSEVQLASFAGTASANGTTIYNPNPFKAATGYTGRNVIFFLDTVDIPDPWFKQKNNSQRYVVGFRGKIGTKLNWTIDTTYDSVTIESQFDNPKFYLNTNWARYEFNPQFTQQRFKIYNFFADHEAHPVPQSTLDEHFKYSTNTDIITQTYTTNGRIYGELLKLPSGPIKFSTKGEYIEYYLDSKTHTTAFNAETFRLITSPTSYNAAVETLTSPSFRSSEYNQSSFAAELSIPLLGKKWKPLGIKNLQSDIARRYSRFGMSDNWRSTEILGMTFQPFDWLILRGSSSSAYIAPAENLTEGSATTKVVSTTINDPERDFQTETLTILQTTGANPDLSGYTARAKNYGFILKPSFMRNTELKVDWWEIKQTNSIILPTIPELLAFFPEKITRAERTQSDIDNNYSGQVTALDLRRVNAVGYFTKGYDISAKYTLPRAAIGQFYLTTIAEYVTTAKEQLRPNLAAAERVGTVGDITTNTTSGSTSTRRNAILPYKWTTSLTWTKVSWNATLSNNYIPRYSTNTTSPTEIIPNATGIDGDYIPSYMTWDLSLGYTHVSRNKGLLSKLANNTQYRFNITNIGDREPNFVTDRGGFYSRFGSATGRYFVLTVKKEM